MLILGTWIFFFFNDNEVSHIVRLYYQNKCFYLFIYLFPSRLRELTTTWGYFYTGKFLLYRYTYIYTHIKVYTYIQGYFYSCAESGN